MIRALESARLSASCCATFVAVSSISLLKGIEAGTEKATKLGAQVVLPKTPGPGAGAVAAIVDPHLGVSARSGP